MYHVWVMIAAVAAQVPILANIHFVTTYEMTGDHRWSLSARRASKACEAYTMAIPVLVLLVSLSTRSPLPALASLVASGITLAVVRRRKLAFGRPVVETADRWLIGLSLCRMVFTHYAIVALIFALRATTKHLV